MRDARREAILFLAFFPHLSLSTVVDGKRPPLERFLEGPSALRTCPEPEKLRVAFRIEENRKQPRSNGTVSIQGVRFEIPSRDRNFENVIVRWRPWDLFCACMMAPLTGNLLCVICPVDKQRNARGFRRNLQDPVKTLDEQLEANDDLFRQLLRKLPAEYSATGLPTAYLPKEERAFNPDDEEGDDEQ